MVKAKNYRNWCTENISPQAWSRIVLKTLPLLRDGGHDLAKLDNPTDDLVLDDASIKILNDALQDLYQLTIEDEVLN